MACSRGEGLELPGVLSRSERTEVVDETFTGVLAGGWTVRVRAGDRGADVAASF